MNIQSIRGMNDILPEDSKLWRYVENKLAELVTNYGYQELRPPLVEFTSLFSRSIGEVTDVVEKEMYNFQDKGGEDIALRPELTAGLVRNVIQHNLAARQKIKLWSLGPAFRYERPQKGRYRQFHQLSIEAFGWESADLDAEMIAMSAQIWKLLDMQEIVNLEINSIGTLQERQLYRQGLIEFLTPFYEQLDSHSQVRLSKNPLRILDSKDKNTQAIVKNAPLLNDFLGEESKQHFATLCDLLDSLNIKYTINPYLVRGLDYYSKTVFEWVTDKLGAQSAVCAGGRYDGLVEQLGGKSTPGIGFAIGLERLIELIKIQGKIEINQDPDIYFIVADETSRKTIMKLSQELRENDFSVITHLGSGSIKSQFKKADQSGASHALIIGEDELSNGSVTLKNLRKKGNEQFEIKQHELVNSLKKLIKTC